MASVRAKFSLLHCDKVILKQNGLVSLSFYMVPNWYQLSVGNVNEASGSPWFKCCADHRFICIHSLQKTFKISFWYSYIRKCYICPEITKNTLIDKGLEFNSLPGERSLYSLFKYLWKNRKSWQFQELLIEILYASLLFHICHAMVSS